MPPCAARLILIGMLFTHPLSAQTPGSAEAKPPRVFCLSREGLAEAKALVARDDSLIRASVRRLRREADQALDVGPFSVVLKGKPPPSGDKHDYLSIAPYVWPDPAKPDGLPYVTRDGFTNPEWWEDYDRVPLERLTQATETLALAYYFTGQESYARHAAHLLRIWFLDPATAMTPDLEFAQTTPGAPNTNRTQIIDGRFLPRLIDAIGLLEGSAAWTAPDQSGMVAWFRQFSANERRRFDETYRASGNNIATFYHVEIAAQALFIGDEALARAMIERMKARMPEVVGADGFFVAERNRTRSFSYSSFHLFALFNLATMGRPLGIDLWNFATPDGRGFRKALDTVAQRAGSYPPKEWPFPETGHTAGDWWDPVHDELSVVLFHATQVYGEDTFKAQARKLFDADAFEANRLQLICGVPLIGHQSLEGWLFHPGREQ